MMLIKKRTIYLLISLACWSSPALADSADDYDVGLKAYTSGSVVDAMTPLRRAADKGHAPAQALLAYILDISELDEEAVAYYQKSSEQGDADGQFGLGSMYLSGEGIAKNLEEARRLFNLSAKQGNKNAIVALAQSYISGGLGLDEAALRGPEALFWIKAAADFDYQPALVALSAAYASGKYGLSIDPKMVESLHARLRKIQEPRDSGNKTTNK